MKPGGETVAWVLTLATRKGGCGKTSLAVNLLGVVASEGLSVALVDLDSQASASRWALGRDAVDRLEREETAWALASLQSSGPGAVVGLQSSPAAPVAVVQPAAAAVARCVHEVAGVAGAVIVPTAPQCRLDQVRELSLRELPVDVVIVDTPPDVGAPVVRAALRQSDAVLAPVVVEAWGLEAAPEIVGAVRDAGRHDLPVRFVVNLRQRRALHDAIETVLRREYRDAVLKAVVSNSAQVAESAARGAPLSAFAPRSACAKVMVSVWREVAKLRRAATAA